ncbi:MAG: class I SAM-dependent methyltransferase [Bryobacteraceae bacterium]
MAAEATDQLSVHYTLKPSPYSSHTLLLGALPGDGTGVRLLDLGCGNGEMGELLAARGFEVTGVERVGGTDSRFPNCVRLIEADLDRGLPPMAGPFDYIICADILEHLKDPAALLRSITGLLSARGALVASLPNSGNIYFRLKILMGQFPQDDKGLFDRTHVHFYMWDGWKELLERNGFKVDVIQPTGIPVGLALPAAADSAPVKAAEWLCYRLALAWKRLFAYQFVVVCLPTAGRGGSA